MVYPELRSPNNSNHIAIVEKRELIRTFLFRALILFISWTLLFNGYIKPHTNINKYLTLAVAHGTSFASSFLGYETKVTSESKMEKDIPVLEALIHLNNEPAALVADACNGLELFVLFIGFLVCFPGSTLPKLLFSITGVAILFFVNILRELALSLNYLHFRSSFDFNHKYTYAIVVYLVVFLMWRFWMNNYSILVSRNKSAL